MKRSHTLSAALLALSAGVDTALCDNRRELHCRAMKFGQPLLTTELSGAMGGAVGSSARGGVGYFRVRRRPGNPRTSFQTFMRATAAALAGAWRNTLTGPQRASWSALAGSTESGIDVYVGSNSQLVRGGQAAVATAPASRSLVADPVTGVAVDSSASTIAFTNSTADGDLYVNVYASSLPQSPSRASQQFPFQYVGTVNLAAAGANALSIPAASGIFAPAVGRVIYVRFVQFNATGQVLQEQIERVTVVA